MSLHAPFTPLNDNTSLQFNRPSATNRQIRSNVNQYYMGHIYSMVSTVPKDYLYWFSPPSSKSLTVTGESKAQILKQFKSSLLQSKLEAACINGVELHCSGYLPQVINILIEIIGSHVHIHNPNICSRLLERFKRFEKQQMCNLSGSQYKGPLGTTQFPGEDGDESFFNRPEIFCYRSTLNCQPVRNFVVEIISLITLSHQKEMALPKINPKI